MREVLWDLMGHIDRIPTFQSLLITPLSMHKTTATRSEGATVLQLHPHASVPAIRCEGAELLPQ
jgi:hypothetical protein